MTPRIPPSNSAAYRAARHLYASGPLTLNELFAAVDCGKQASTRRIMVDGALTSGWLIEVGGKIGVSKTTRAHFDDAAEPEAKPAGQVATSRDHTSVYERPALSRKNMPSSKGTRDDVPAFSVRETPSFRSVGGQP